MAENSPPSAAEVAALLDDLQRLYEVHGGAHRVPADELAAWEAQKRDLLERVRRHDRAPVEGGER